MVKHEDIIVNWDRKYTFETQHDLIDIKRWGYTENIYESNTDGLYDVLIKGDTIIIQTTPNLIIYKLSALTLNCYIKIDSSITTCQYMKKHNPENAKYFCNETKVDSSKAN